MAQESAELRNDRPREQSPEEIRRDIERTRAGLGETLEDIENRVSPSRIKERKTAQLRQRWHNVRNSVMGSTDDLQSRSSGQVDRVSDRVDEFGNRISDRVDEFGNRISDAGDSIRQAPDQALQRAQGNPLAAGLIAFGGGLLLASLLPSSREEQRAVQQLRDRFEEPVRNELQEVGTEAKDHLQEHAQQAAEQVKSTAQEGVEHTKEDAQRAAQRTQDHAQSAAQRTKSDAQQTAGQVRDEAQQAGQETRNQLR